MIYASTEIIPTSIMLRKITTKIVDWLKRHDAPNKSIAFPTKIPVKYPTKYTKTIKTIAYLISLMAVLSDKLSIPLSLYAPTTDLKSFSMFTKIFLSKLNALL